MPETNCFFFSVAIAKSSHIVLPRAVCVCVCVFLWFLIDSIATLQSIEWWSVAERMKRSPNSLETIRFIRFPLACVTLSRSQVHSNDRHTLTQKSGKKKMEADIQILLRNKWNVSQLQTCKIDADITESQPNVHTIVDAHGRTYFRTSRAHNTTESDRNHIAYFD